jgi:cytochrome b
MEAKIQVRVWDLGVRLSHWLMVVLVLVGWLTGEEEGVACEIHRYSGEALAGVLMFRLIWAFIGGEHARLASFLRGPAAVASHVRDLATGRAHQTLGHNVLGGWASILLWSGVLATVATGLMSLAEEGVSGPLAAPLGLNLADAHEVAFRVLQGLVLVHLVGVAFMSVASKDNLIRAMITGSKSRPPTESAREPRAATSVSALAAVTVAAVTGLGLMALPHPYSRDGHEGAAAEHARDTDRGAAEQEEGEHE